MECKNSYLSFVRLALFGVGLVFIHSQALAASFTIEFWATDQLGFKTSPTVQGITIPLPGSNPTLRVLSDPPRYTGSFKIADSALGTPNGFISLTSLDFLSFNAAIDNASFEIPDDPLRLCGLAFNGTVRCEPENNRLGVRLDPEGKVQRFDIPSSFVSNADSIVDTDFDISNSGKNHPQLVLWDRDPESGHNGYFVKDDDGDWVLVSGTTANRHGWVDQPLFMDEIITPTGKIFIDSLVHEWDTFNWHGTDPSLGNAAYFRIAAVTEPPIDDPMTPTPDPIPEPSTFLLLGSGLIGLLATRKKIAIKAFTK